MVEFLQSERTRLLWDAALVLLRPIVVNLIIPRCYLSSRSSLPHFCSLIMPAASRWLLCPPPASYSARNGTLHSPVWHFFNLEPSRAETRDMTLKMWLGWMAALCHRGSGRLFQLCLQRRFFLPADLRDRFPLWRSDGLTGRTGQAGFCCDGD